ASGNIGARDVSAITNVPAAARLIRANEISADDDVVAFGDERLLVGTRPIGQRGGSAQVRVERIRRAFPNDREDDLEDCRAVARLCLPDLHQRAPAAIENLSCRMITLATRCKPPSIAMR